jgi:hypothetical protein
MTTKAMHVPASGPGAGAEESEAQGREGCLGQRDIHAVVLVSFFGLATLRAVVEPAA